MLENKLKLKISKERRWCKNYYILCIFNFFPNQFLLRQLNKRNDLCSPHPPPFPSLWLWVRVQTGYPSWSLDSGNRTFIHQQSGSRVKQKGTVFHFYQVLSKQCITLLDFSAQKRWFLAFFLLSDFLKYKN